MCAVVCGTCATWSISSVCECVLCVLTHTKTSRCSWRRPVFVVGTMMVGTVVVARGKRSKALEIRAYIRRWWCTITSITIHVKRCRRVYIHIYYWSVIEYLKKFTLRIILYQTLSFSKFYFGVNHYWEIGFDDGRIIHVWNSFSLLRFVSKIPFYKIICFKPTLVNMLHALQIMLYVLIDAYICIKCTNVREKYLFY